MVQDFKSLQVQKYKVAPAPGSSLSGLIYNLELAVDLPDSESIAARVRDVMMRSLESEDSIIPERFLQPFSDSYARRLIYLGADTRFSLLAMVWQPGQKTPLHDHGGQWCVECVYKGEIVGTNYVLDKQVDDRFYFSERSVVREVEGQSSALVPPFDHHVLENRSNDLAVTLHVYANELLSCNVYQPAEKGGYDRKVSKLGYTN